MRTRRISAEQARMIYFSRRTPGAGRVGTVYPSKKTDKKTPPGKKTTDRDRAIARLRAELTRAAEDSRAEKEAEEAWFRRREDL